MSLRRLFFAPMSSDPFFNSQHRDLMNHFNRKDLAVLSQINSLFKRAVAVPKILNLITQYKLEDKEVEQINALKAQGYALELYGHQVTNPILLALELELRRNPLAALQRSVITDPLGMTYECNALEYAILTGNFTAIRLMRNHLEFNEDKEENTYLEKLKVYSTKPFDFNLFLQDFEKFLRRYGGNSSLRGNLANVTQNYKALIGTHLKRVPAWIAQLYCSSLLLYEPKDFKIAILEAQATDRIIGYKSYYAGSRLVKGDKDYYKELFVDALYSVGGWASCDVVVVSYGDLAAYTALNKVIGEELEHLFPAQSPILIK